LVFALIGGSFAAARSSSASWKTNAKGRFRSATEVALFRVDQRGWDGFLCNIGAAVIGDGGDIIELPGSIDGSVAVTGLGAVIPSIPCSPSDEPSPHATTRLQLMISTSTRVLMRNPPSSVTGLPSEREKFTLRGYVAEDFSASDKVRVLL
jgi:hypothetical protein